MAGHRRISNDLLREELERKGYRNLTPVECLLWLDGDVHRREVKSARAYSAIWRVSRRTAQRLMRAYLEHHEDLRNAGGYVEERATNGTSNSSTIGATIGARGSTTQRDPEPEPDPEKEAPAAGAASSPRGSWSTRCAEVMVDLLEPVPGAVIPDNAARRWAREFEALARDAPELQETDPEPRVRDAIVYALGPENLGRDFEVVIRSGRDLRDKWPKLVARMLRDHQQGEHAPDWVALETEYG